MMCKTLKIFFGIMLVVVFTVALVAPGFSKEPSQTRCPVLGNPVNKKLFVDYQGKRVYFCCPPCIREFKKNPEKYINEMEKKGIVLEEAPKADKK